MDLQTGNAPQGLSHMDKDKDLVQMELLESRRRLKYEMQKALSCISPKAKRLLAAEWREKYSELFYRELINCAKNKVVAVTIADWDLNGFDKKRSK